MNAETLFGIVFVGIPIGIVLDELAGWLAHRLTIRRRADVRSR